jgi:hypothetical protein
MAYVPNCGGTLLIPSGTFNSPDQMHLFVIVTEKCAENRHLLVNISTIRDGVHFDPACIVEAGEHPFVTDRSYVVYRLARIDHAAHLSKCVDGWTFRPKENVTQELLNRICDGVLRSEFIGRADRAYYRKVTGL